MKNFISNIQCQNPDVLNQINFNQLQQQFNNNGSQNSIHKRQRSISTNQLKFFNNFNGNGGGNQPCNNSNIFLNQNQCNMSQIFAVNNQSQIFNN